MVQADPTNSIARMQLGVSYGKRGRAADAERELRESLRLDPSNPRAHYNLAALLLGQDRVAEAAAADAEGHNNLGMVYGQLGRHAEALAEVEAALRLRSDLAATHFNVGQAHARLGHEAEARRAFRRAAELDPRYAPGPKLEAGNRTNANPGGEADVRD